MALGNCPKRWATALEQLWATSPTTIGSLPYCTALGNLPCGLGNLPHGLSTILTPAFMQGMPSANRRECHLWPGNSPDDDPWRNHLWSIRQSLGNKAWRPYVGSLVCTILMRVTSSAEGQFVNLLWYENT